MTLWRSGLLVVSGNVIEIVCTFARNVLLARLLGVEDFGIAATFSLLVSLMDMAGQVGLERMVVQAHDADDPVFQATLHLAQFGLGSLAALILLVVSAPYAAFMATPQLTWAYALLAFIPCLRGLMHLDMQRLQREGRFGPSTVRQVVPQLIGLAAIYPAYLWLGDYRVALVMILAQQISQLIASHLGASRPYRFAFDRAVIRRAKAFGLPLMANSLLMYFVFNGDRMVVANQFGLHALGWFSAAITLTMMPMNIIAKSVQTLFLPTMSRQQGNQLQLQKQYELSINATSFIGLVFVAGVALLGGWALELTFGPKFAPARPFLAMLAIVQWFRLVRAMPALAAMARAETRNPLYTNIVRGIFILIAFLVTILTKDITLMIMCGIIGEFVATTFAGWLAQRTVGVGSAHFDVVLGASGIMAALICLVQVRGWPLLALAPGLALFLFVIRGLFSDYRMLLRRR